MKLRTLGSLLCFGANAALVIGTAGCSSSNSPGTTATAGGQAFGAVNTNLSKLAVPPGGAASLTLGEVEEDLASGPIHALSNTTDWTTALLSDPRNSGGTCTYTAAIPPQTYMKIDFTQGAVRCNGSDVNVFGRMHSALSMSCMLGHMISEASTDLLPTTGSRTITVDSSLLSTINTDCGTNITSAQIPSSMTVTFAVPTDTTTFDRILTMSVVQSGTTQTMLPMYIRYNSTKVAVARNETNSNGANRAIVTLDKTTNILKGEYISGPNTSSLAGFDGVYIHRIYYDANNDLGRVYSSIESANPSGGAVTTVNARYVVTGKPQTKSQDFAVGLDFYGSGWGSYTTSGSSYNLSACVANATGAITSNPTVTSNQFTCGAVTGISPAGITADATIWTAIHGSVSTWHAFTAVPSITWDMNSIYTAGITL